MWGGGSYYHSDILSFLIIHFGTVLGLIFVPLTKHIAHLSPLFLFIEKFFLHFWISSHFLSQVLKIFFLNIHSIVNMLLTFFWPSICIPVLLIGKWAISRLSWLEQGCLVAHLQWLQPARMPWEWCPLKMSTVQASTFCNIFSSN